MDVLDKKKPINFDNDLIELITTIQYNRNLVIFNGSASLQNIKYFSDYDFYTEIKDKNANKAYDNLETILNNISQKHRYFLIEVKLQLKNGEKFKYTYPDILDKEQFLKVFKDLDFFKIDLVWANYEYRLMEASIIYKIYDKNFNEKDEQQKIIKGIKNDIKEYLNDKNYYKVLKREFSLISLQDKPDFQKLKILAEFFNSDSGKLYFYKGNIDAINRLFESYGKQHNYINKLIKENLKLIKPFKLTDYEKIDETINKEAYSFGSKNKFF